ncbi:MAG: prolipoprotein diacylglyceryl transferase [Desulfomonile tiedjei]|nr:prolipoprotein diacylglyceryl transferase [Desulfomonile tiedjei]
MWDAAFISAMGLLFAMLLRWACRTLPGEDWQIMAAVPVAKRDSATWVGANLTYYGLFVSGSCVLGVTLFLVLMGAVGCQARISLLVVLVLLGLCVPASNVLARLVEKKHHTLTIGGASFLGVLVTPGILWCANAIAESAANLPVPMVPALASLSIAYAIGEGVGRLACISFGCCYGKPLADCSPWIRRAIGAHGFVFSGSTKKIAYEGGSLGKEVVPIQAMTSAVFLGIGLVSMFLYLGNHHFAAVAVSIVMTQTWRALSETLRADYRGGGTFSAYQVMAVVAAIYTLGLLWILPAEPVPPASLAAGVTALWDPVVPFALQSLGLAVFLFSGRSRVTGSTLSFHVLPDRL